MERIYRITFKNDEVAKKLLKLKISFEMIDGLGFFKISEFDPKWPEIKNIIKDFNLSSPFCELKFTKKEIEEAEWLVVYPRSHWSYPQPEDDEDEDEEEEDNGPPKPSIFTYEKVTYNLENYCLRCGIGAVQNRPFQLKKEPEWGSKHFLQLNWVFDEYFVRSEVFNEIKKRKLTGVSSITPIHYKTQKPLKTVVQLKIDYILPPGIANKLEPIVCGKEKNPFPHLAKLPPCGRTKFYPIESDQQLKIKKDIFKGAPDFVKTNEIFGDGASAHKEVIISGRVRDLILEKKWKGLILEPIELV